MRKMTKRSTAIVAGVAVVALGGTAAFAAVSGWFNGADSNVTASTAEIKPVTARITVGSNLWAGKTVDADVTIGNYNEFKVKATEVKAGSIVVSAYNNASDAARESGAVGGCGTNEADIELGSLPTAGILVDPGKWSLSQTLTKFVTMKATADPACAGKVLRINFTLDGELVNTP
ncbi:hypothetical protein [Paractinoplanes durhamensis]|uniref:Ribosomally synthesized peptide with SipW-like signal peptide n=1 Tax=Paractinoplanes durhamensis TaxID=113563 RepID=A0ABQ3YP57_9ACTN|nr:hypothetical protein [Actinoplanes durhamensis]GID99365.1 hypothetical protein Adu01nite_07160 [Actinoplanes durhamensis]